MALTWQLALILIAFGMALGAWLYNRLVSVRLHIRFKEQQADRAARQASPTGEIKAVQPVTPYRPPPIGRMPPPPPDATRMRSIPTMPPLGELRQRDPTTWHS